MNNSNQLSGKPGPNRFVLAPQTTLGWWALVMTVLSVASWWVLPQITRAYRDSYPITDTWVMPVILMVLTDAAAALNVLAIWRKHERSIVILMMALVLVPAALFISLMVIGEGLAGV